MLGAPTIGPPRFALLRGWTIDLVPKKHYTVTMASITIRNIPDEVLERIRALSSIERRSLNNEILVILERGTYSEYEEKLVKRKYLSKSTQMEIWKQLAGTWSDSRSAKEIIEDIYAHRTAGREVEL
jgi:plasmid stability protein